MKIEEVPPYNPEFRLTLDLKEFREVYEALHEWWKWRSNVGSENEAVNLMWRMSVKLGEDPTNV